MAAFSNLNVSYGVSILKVILANPGRFGPGSCRPNFWGGSFLWCTERSKKLNYGICYN